MHDAKLTGPSDEDAAAQLQPEMGRIVIFTLKNHEQPAMITKMNRDGTANLMAFRDGWAPMFYERVPRYYWRLLS